MPRPMAPALAIAALGAVTLTACLSADRGAGDRDAGDADAASGDAGVDAGPCPVLLTDKFGGPALDAATWTTVHFGGGSESLSVEDRLEIGLSFASQEAPSEYGVVSLFQTFLDDTTLTAKVELDTSNDLAAGIAWANATRDYVAVYTQGGQLHASSGTGLEAPIAQCDTTCPPYETDTLVQLRLRALGRQVSFEWSSDGLVWEEIATSDTDLDEVRAVLFVSGSTGVGTLRATRIDWTDACAL